MADLANRKENSSSAVGYCMSINCPAIDFKQRKNFIYDLSYILIQK